MHTPYTKLRFNIHSFPLFPLLYPCPDFLLIHTFLLVELRDAFSVVSSADVLQGSEVVAKNVFLSLQSRAEMFA